jgi:RNA ligase (TIGR02306 family)
MKIKEGCVVIRISDIQPHGNADRLEIVVVNGWQVVVQKGAYKAGDLALYIPMDSVLPPWLEAKLFPPDSKIKLTNSRVRCAKIRGVASFGMLVPQDVLEFPLVEGVDHGETLNILAWEPEEEEGMIDPAKGASVVKKKAKIKQLRYIDIMNLRNCPNSFSEGEWVYITAKLHGTSVRFGYFPVVVKSFLHRFFMWLGIMKKTRWMVGSRNTEVAETSTYGRHASEWRSKLRSNEIVFGEIVGPKIQKGYHYGCRNGETAFYAYDVMVDGKFLGCTDFKLWCDVRGVPRVPELGVFPYKAGLEKALADSPVCLNGQQTREGVVIKTLDGRVVRKYVSDAFLLAKNTGFH